MINHFAHVSLYKDDLGTIARSEETKKSFVLSYPCSLSYQCTPYVLKLKVGTYKFECWGSSATTWKSTPGLGGYTSGILYVHKPTTFYVYVGTQGFFNAMKENPNLHTTPRPGGATDIRLNYSDNWWDEITLISRIMVAAGGGGAEWNWSIGGNGGGLQGGESLYYSNKCPGATQTSGSECDDITIFDGSTFSASKGSFGSAGIIQPYQNDFGPTGGGGYYGGTSYPYSFSASGGSSFISGHIGCDAVKDQTETIEHTGQPNHYSGFIFTNTEMISGNNSMPIPTSLNERQIYSGKGAFRLTLIHYQYHCTYHNTKFRFLPILYL